MPDLYRVLRAFEGPNARTFQPGDVVDTTGWRYTRNLVERRYLAPVPADAEPARAPATRRAS